MSLTHWKKLFNPDYLGAWAFQPGEEMTVTITSVNTERITGADGKTEECPVVHFSEDIKPMILNSTNAKMITKMLNDPHTENWVGKRIVLGVERVKAFGDVVDAVRVQKKQPAPSAVCAECGQTISASGKFSAQQIAAAAQKRFGRALCLTCAEKVKEAKGE